MAKLFSILNAWPALIASAISAAMIFSTAAEQVVLPDWLIDTFAQGPTLTDDPVPPAPEPERKHAVPYAPAPGRDDRTPIEFISHVFELYDPKLTSKLSGVGPVYWDHATRGTGALIARDLVLTTGHLFAEDGKWDGPFGPTNKPPAPSDGRIYIAACERTYDFRSIHLGSLAPRKRLGLDYAIAELSEPACAAATPLPLAHTPDDLVGAEEQILFNMGAYPIEEVERYATHPLFAERLKESSQFSRQTVFGVSCTAAGRRDTGDVAEGSTAVIETEGCDGVPGGSGGPLLVSRDGGAGYSIIGVANSYRPDTEYNNYTRIEGAFAKHLGAFVELAELPAAIGSSAIASTSDIAGPWLPMASDGPVAVPSHIAKPNPLVLETVLQSGETHQ
ncbi:trypsin-like serine peptidase [Roseobacter sp. MH60115]|uniref:trypsin-like serine peptidase n=1 Tax=Roseobacter sp. MH60115 TaxID=2785324 RepID=UPI0018A32ACB|nr:trypsin-like peptidase domain-containing protein [Roseobacter sp. MH60115]